MKKTVFITFSFFVISLSLHAQSYLYGVNLKGNGAITRYDFKANTLKAIYSLTEADGDAPYSGMIKGVDGLLYGVTSYNGSNNYGALFSFNPLSQQFSKLHDFNGLEGGQPTGSLLKASNGILYGLSLLGGTGCIYSYDPAARLYRNHYVFNKNDGEGLYGSLVQATDGKLYGVTFGNNDADLDIPNAGSLSVFDPINNSLKKLYTFDGYSGAHPYGSLLLGTDHKLYGATQKGGTHDAGVLFSFDPQTARYVKLYDFDGTNGAMPFSNLMQATDGFLYGTTKEGGSHGAGIIYSFDPIRLTFRKLHEFQISDGAEPASMLVEASNNLLYGTTEHGGKHNLGVLYELDRKSLNVRTLQDYDGINGSFPHYGALIEMKPGTPGAITSVSRLTLSSFPNPSSAHFNVSIEHTNNDLVELRIFDAGGKLVEVKRANANTIIRLGQTYAPGTYFLKAAQGTEKATLELIKK